MAHYSPAIPICIQFSLIHDEHLFQTDINFISNSFDETAPLIELDNYIRFTRKFDISYVYSMKFILNANLFFIKDR